MARGVVGSAEYQLGADLRPLSKDLKTAEGWLQRSGLKSEQTYKRAVSTGLGVGGGLIAVQALAKGFDIISGTIGGSIEAASEFEGALAMINTVAKLTDNQLASLGESIQGLAVDAGKQTGELTDAMYNLVSAGVAASDAMGVLEDSTNLSTGALSTTNEAVDLVTTSLNAWKLAATESARVTDVFAQTVANGKVTAAQLAASIAQVAPIAAATGVAIEEVAAGYATMTAQGTPAAQAATQMRAALTALLKPNAQLVALQDQLGGTTFEAMLASEGLAATLQKVSDVADGQTDVITAALGSTEAYNGMLQITGGNAAAFARNLDDMKRAAREGGVAVGMAAKRMDTLEFRQQQLAAKNQVLMQDIGAALLPVMEGITAAASAAIDAVRGLAEGIDGLITGVSDFIDPARVTRREMEAFANELPPSIAAAFLEWADAQEAARKATDANLDTVEKLGRQGEDYRDSIMGSVADMREMGLAHSDIIAEIARSTNTTVDQAQEAGRAAREAGGGLKEQVEALILLGRGEEQHILMLGKSGEAVASYRAQWDAFLADNPQVVAELERQGRSAKAAGDAAMHAAMQGEPLSETLTTTKWRAKGAALALAGLEGASIDLAVRGLGRLKSEAKDAEAVWDKIKGGADGNRKALRKLTDQIGIWKRRYKKALEDNDTEAAAFAALQIERLTDEKNERQAVIDEIKEQQRQLWLLGEEVKGLPSHKTVDVAVNIIGNIGGALKDAIIPWLASGGPTQARKAYIVGEQGPELWVEDRPGYMLDAKATARAMSQSGSSAMGAIGAGSGGNSITIHVHAGAFLGNPEDAQRLGRELTPILRRELDRLALHP